MVSLSTCVLMLDENTGWGARGVWVVPDFRGLRPPRLPDPLCYTPGWRWYSPTRGAHAVFFGLVGLVALALAAVAGADRHRRGGAPQDRAVDSGACSLQAENRWTITMHQTRRCASPQIPLR